MPNEEITVSVERLRELIQCIGYSIHENGNLRPKCVARVMNAPFYDYERELLFGDKRGCDMFDVEGWTKEFKSRRRGGKK